MMEVYIQGFLCRPGVGPLICSMYTSEYTHIRLYRVVRGGDGYTDAYPSPTIRVVVGMPYEYTAPAAGQSSSTQPVHWPLCRCVFEFEQPPPPPPLFTSCVLDSTLNRRKQNLPHILATSAFFLFEPLLECAKHHTTASPLHSFLHPQPLLLPGAFFSAPWG